MACRLARRGTFIFEEENRATFLPSDGEPRPKSFSRVLGSSKPEKHTLVLSLTGSYPSGHSEAFTRPAYGLIPVPIDQNPCAHWRSPMDMMRQGWSTSLFQALQQ